EVEDERVEPAHDVSGVIRALPTGTGRELGDVTTGGEVAPVGSKDDSAGIGIRGGCYCCSHLVDQFGHQSVVALVAVHDHDSDRALVVHTHERAELDNVADSHR